MKKLSIIIPVLNEAATIQDSLQALQASSTVEIIVVDGGSHDNTVILAQELGVNVLVSPQKGRAAQMNTGTTIATGEVLLFLHADTRLPPGYTDLITQGLSHPEIVAGAFSLRIDGEARSLRLIETMVNLRSRFFSLPYGDQGIFVKTSVFKVMGGFQDLPIMEDFEFVRRLKRQGKLTIIPTPVITSDRRWRKLGVFRTTLVNQFIILGYFLGISPVQLRRWYDQ